MNDRFLVLRRLFRDVLEDDSLDLQPDHSQSSLDGWDSFAHVKLIIALEEEFGVKFSIDEVANTKTAGRLAELIDAKLGTAG